MISPQLAGWVDQIRRALPEAESIDGAIAIVKRSVESMFGELTSLHEELLQEAEKIIRKDYEQVEILRNISIFSKRPDWYFGPKPKDSHWPALEGYVIQEKGWNIETVKSMNVSSSEVISLIENPHKDKFSCRGLVLGYVQSGKTANMTAVIAKAIDAGYNTVIVLAGLTDKLRQQTQRRLESDVVKRLPERWNLLTSDQGDFRGLTNGGFPRLAQDNAQIAVVKKNVAPLNRLLETISSTHKLNLQRLKVLLIDDECDQASVNSASKELDITSINMLIRKIVNFIPCISYVGYTATPFANVLINPYPVDGSGLDDLYPKDFITSLPLPLDYFGAERLFGRAPVNSDAESPDEQPLNMIRAVSAQDSALLQPPSIKLKDSFFPKIPPSLEDALLYFLMCCAARCTRGHEHQHMTMLVHTSPFVIMHERVASVMEAWLQKNRASILLPSSPIRLRMKNLWVSESTLVPSKLLTTYDPVNFDVLENHLPHVISELNFAIENGSSSDRIDYTKPARIYVVVGGSILARGLTLEGLMVSYFLRSSTRQYDTLLQMGRWFGYRHNYEDLPRLWMPKDLSKSFRDLAAIEAEIRDDISQYKNRMTPTDFAVRIRTLPGMTITAATKMRAAKSCDLSYSGKHVQSIRLNYLNEKEIHSNWQAAAELLTQASQFGDLADIDQRKLYLEVPQALVVKFLRSYTLHDSRHDLGTRALLAYIENSVPALMKWNVGVFETVNGQSSKLPLGALGHVKMANRSVLDTSGEIANIKALMSRRDVIFDCPTDQKPTADDWSTLKAFRESLVGEIPLIIIYPINRNSKPTDPNTHRSALNAQGDLIGIGIIFPGDEQAGGGYVSVSLDAISADELEAIEQEELAQSEAAGV
ncbi:Z1 domain-containing protein [Pseudomonas fluorescens]|uniref:Putative endonuclease Z1 domain-containing protein n=1 Tax=Pseudomonas fluorescens TaxID=294 RepID=A0A5E7FU62_PSEFL|nr:Z1 domain-containing protein [Pseudomonas fluorescens]VVO42192.1 hypothetical protein PS710_06005 [Pseudomonas fluorescens]